MTTDREILDMLCAGRDPDRLSKRTLLHIMVMQYRKLDMLTCELYISNPHHTVFKDFDEGLLSQLKAIRRKRKGPQWLNKIKTRSILLLLRGLQSWKRKSSKPEVLSVLP